MNADEQERIMLLQTALAGASTIVYEWAAKYIHSEAQINTTIQLPCCKQKSFINPTNPADIKLDEAKTKPLWIPVMEMGVVKKQAYNPMSLHIAKGAHIKLQYQGVTMEAIAQKFGKSLCRVLLMEKGYEIDVVYAQITHVNAHSPGKPHAGFKVTWPVNKYGK
jgi:hypothetical protein